MNAIVFGLLCAITIIFMIVIGFLSFDVFSNIANSILYISNTEAKRAHTYFMVSFILIAITIIVFIIGISVIGIEKIIYDKKGKKRSKEEIMNEIQRLSLEIKTKGNKMFRKSSSEDVEKEQIKLDKEIIKGYGDRDKIFTFILIVLGMLSLVVLILISIGQYNLGKAKSASSTGGTVDSFLSKASVEGWFAIGFAIAILIMIIVIIILKARAYFNERNIVKQAEEIEMKI